MSERPPQDGCSGKGDPGCSLNLANPGCSLPQDNIYSHDYKNEVTQLYINIQICKLHVMTIAENNFVMGWWWPKMYGPRYIAGQ